MLTNIFEPFVRSSTSNHSWGLGRPIVNGIAEAHHGHVSVNSGNSGNSTIFTMTLPRDSRAEEAT